MVGPAVGTAAAAPGATVGRAPRLSPGRGRARTKPAFRFRLNRDAAHLDGLLPIGPDKRRMVKEPHAWILGLPLNACGAGASPLVVWEGSP